MRIDVHLHTHESNEETHAVLNHVVTLLEVIHNQGVKIMASVKELSDELTAIKTAVDEAKATGLAQIQLIAELTKQIEAGSPVTQEQLDALDAQADEILASLSPEQTEESKSRNR